MADLTIDRANTQRSCSFVDTDPYSLIPGGKQ